MAVDKHKAWLGIGVTVAVIILAVLLLYPFLTQPAGEKKAMAGKATGTFSVSSYTYQLSEGDWVSMEDNKGTCGDSTSCIDSGICTLAGEVVGGKSYCVGTSIWSETNNPTNDWYYCNEDAKGKFLPKFYPINLGSPNYVCDGNKWQKCDVGTGNYCIASNVVKKDSQGKYTLVSGADSEYTLGGVSLYEFAQIKDEFSSSACLNWVSDSPEHYEFFLGDTFPHKDDVILSDECGNNNLACICGNNNDWLVCDTSTIGVVSDGGGYTCSDSGKWIINNVALLDCTLSSNWGKAGCEEGKSCSSVNTNVIIGSINVPASAHPDVAKYGCGPKDACVNNKGKSIGFDNLDGTYKDYLCGFNNKWWLCDVKGVKGVSGTPINWKCTFSKAGYMWKKPVETAPTATTTETKCVDGKDDDGDTKIDAKDSDCLGTSCTPSATSGSTGNSLFIWSYNLPSEQALKDGGSVPARTGCCGEDQCITAAGLCKNVKDLVSSDAYLCISGNTWARCGGTGYQNGETKLAGEFICNGVKWEKKLEITTTATEDCSTPVDDDKDGMVNCKDSNCASNANCPKETGDACTSATLPLKRINNVYHKCAQWGKVGLMWLVYLNGPCSVDSQCISNTACEGSKCLGKEGIACSSSGKPNNALCASGYTCDATTKKCVKAVSTKTVPITTASETDTTTSTGTTTTGTTTTTTTISCVDADNSFKDGQWNIASYLIKSNVISQYGTESDACGSSGLSERYCFSNSNEGTNIVPCGDFFSGTTCNDGACVESQCQDGKDNDADGLVDCKDSSCEGQSVYPNNNICCVSNDKCKVLGYSSCDQSTNFCAMVSTLAGDITGANAKSDGCVNLDDIAVIAENVNLDCVGTSNPATIPAGDTNNDGCVNLDDIAVIAENVNLDCVPK